MVKSTRSLLYAILLLKTSVQAQDETNGELKTLESYLLEEPEEQQTAQARRRGVSRPRARRRPTFNDAMRKRQLSSSKKSSKSESSKSSKKSSKSSKKSSEEQDDEDVVTPSASTSPSDPIGALVPTGSTSPSSSTAPSSSTPPSTFDSDTPSVTPSLSPSNNPTVPESAEADSPSALPSIANNDEIDSNSPSISPSITPSDLPSISNQPSTVAEGTGTTYFIGSTPSNHMSGSANLAFLLTPQDTEPSISPSTEASEEEVVQEQVDCRSSLCSIRTQANDGNLCCNAAADNCDANEITYPLPYFRYGNWNSVQSNFTMQYFAEEFGYTAETWEQPGTNRIEAFSFLEVRDKELLEYMGMTQYTWDCWINHYVAYSWAELECYDLAGAYTILGWSESTWGSSDPTMWPVTESKEWNLLSSEEQDAARQVCFFPELWDGYFLRNWPADWDSFATHTPPPPPPPPTISPSNRPTLKTTHPPSQKPTTDQPTSPPSPSPSRDAASDTPTPLPTVSPTHRPSLNPTTSPPTPQPSTEQLTHAPTHQPTLPPTTLSPTPSPTRRPTRNPTTSPPTLQPVTSLPTTQPTTDKPTPYHSSSPSKEKESDTPTIESSLTPTMEPTDFPSSFPTSAEDRTCRSSLCSARTAENEGNFCCGLFACDPTKLTFPIPYFRFEPWETSSFASLADQVGYAEETWDRPGENEIEGDSYANIENSAVLDQMGFTQYTWDCWVNHYTDYSWAELECYGLSPVYETLGWNGSSWQSENENDWPIQEFTKWELLYDSEKEAAEKLCYSPDIWDTRRVSQWESDWDLHFSDSLSCRSSICSTRTAANEDKFCCDASTCDKDSITSPLPYFKFETWEEMDSHTKEYAEELGYTNNTWNFPGTHEIESLSFAYITNTENIKEMGFTQHTWDCWVNHYVNYTWEELECYGLSGAVKSLGWEESTWQSENEDDWPVQEFTNWELLYENEQSAAKELCYFPELWDQERISKWGFEWDSYVRSSGPLEQQSSTSLLSDGVPTAGESSGGVEVTYGNIFGYREAPAKRIP